MELVIGNKNYSSWSLRPWYLLKMHGIHFEERRIALFKDETDEQLKPYFSNFKVPVLIDEDLTIWDSMSIMEYISEKYIAGAGWPHDRKQRAIARSVCAEMHSSFVALRSAMPMNCRIATRDLVYSSEVKADIQRINDLWMKCRLNHADQGEWLFGKFSIADAMYAPVVLRFASYGVELVDHSQAYMRTVLSSPPIIEWIEAGKSETEVIEMNEIG